jgi:hypothetical protein
MPLYLLIARPQARPTSCTGVIHLQRLSLSAKCQCDFAVQTLLSCKFVMCDKYLVEIVLGPRNELEVGGPACIWLLVSFSSCHAPSWIYLSGLFGSARPSQLHHTCPFQLNVALLTTWMLALTMIVERIGDHRWYNAQQISVA